MIRAGAAQIPSPCRSHAIISAALMVRLVASRATSGAARVRPAPERQLGGV